MSLTPPVTIRLDDPVAERVRRNHETRIAELQRLPAMAIIVIRNISCVNNNTVTVAHGLGREPIWIAPSCIRWDKAPFVAAGDIFDYGTVDQLGNPIDRSQVVVLVPGGFTSAGSVTITFDLLVM